MPAPEKESNCDRVTLVLDVISHATELYVGGRAAYVYGMGGQPSGFYRRLAKSKVALLKWTGPTVTGVGRVLSFFIPSHAGVLLISDLNALKPIVLELSDSTMIGLYIFKTDMESDFVRLVKSRSALDEIDGFVLTDAKSLIYQVDPNNPSAGSGMYEFIQFGVDVSPEVRRKLST